MATKGIHSTRRSGPAGSAAPRTTVCAAAVLLLVTGCASYQTLAPEEIRQGDYVHVSVWGGGTESFEVREVREGLVIGERVELALTDIEQVSRMVPLVEDAEHAGPVTRLAEFLYFVFSLNWLR